MVEHCPKSHQIIRCVRRDTSHQTDVPRPGQPHGPVRASNVQQNLRLGNELQRRRDDSARTRARVRRERRQAGEGRPGPIVGLQAEPRAQVQKREDAGRREENGGAVRV